MSDSKLDMDLSKLKIDKSRRKQRGDGLNRYVTLLLLAIVFGGGGYFAYMKFFPATIVQVVQPTLETGVQQPLGEAVLTAGGYIVARDVYVISTKIDGRVEDIFIERGDLVETGDTIITIEDEEFVSRVRFAEAQVASAKARLNQLRAGSRPEEIARVKAEAASAKARAIQAKKEQDRVAGLAEEGISSPADLDVSKANRSVADANLAALRELVRLAELGPRKEEIQVSEAQLLEVKANLDYAKTQLSFTIITAPITGTILEKVAKKGEMVTTSNFGGSQGARSAAVTMADLTDLQVELDINEDDLPRITMGQNCEIRVDSYPNEAVRGVVDEIAPRADRQKATVQVKVKILEPPSFIRPEVNARVSFLRDAPVEQQEETPARDSLWVPRASIVQTEDGPAVYLVFEGRALLRSVMMGREGPLGFEITDGLLGDENIIVAPLDQITDGMSVAVGAAR